MIDLYKIIIFYIFIFTTSTIIISYGRSFSELFKIKISCISINIIFGCFILGSLALIINFFLPINIYVGNIILLIGFILILKNANFLRKELLVILIISSIAFITGIYENINRPDAALYHLPFISNLNENKIILGLNNLHSRFGSVSFLQYVSAVFYNSLFINKVIFFPNLILFASSLIYFFKICIDKTASNEIKILSLFFAIAIVLDMNRFSEFGNDENAHMLYFILISQIIIFYINKNISIQNTTSIILFISLFLFMIKITYSLVIFFVILIVSKSFKEFKFFDGFKLFLYFIFFSWLLKNFFISGCFLYPIEFTCVDKISWTYNANIDSVIIEGWAKGYPDTNLNLPIEKYIKNLNWLGTWLNNHSLFILKKLLLLLTIFILIVIFINKKGIELNFRKELKIILIINLFFCCVWFLKFPVYRFGSGFLISGILLTTIIFFKRINLYNYDKALKISIVFTLILLCYKNLDRTIIKIKKDIYEPWINIYTNYENEVINYEKVKFSNFEDEFYYVPVGKKLCFYSPSPCTHILSENLQLKKIGNYKIILRRF